MLGVIWLVCCLRTKGETFTFNAGGKDGDFDKILEFYVDLAKFVVGLAAGAIVLVIGSSVFGASKHLPEAFASPLLLLALSILCGLIFMVFLVFNYEAFKHDPRSYTRFRYVRNQAFGFAGLVSFCAGYGWLIMAAVRG